MAKADLATIKALAAERDHVLARRELLAAGVGPQVIARRVSSGLLTRIFPGVYLFGGESLTQRQLLQAGLAYGWAAGHTAALSGYTAGEVHGVVRPFIGRGTISTTRSSLIRTIRSEIPMTSGILGSIRYRSTQHLEVEVVDGLAATPIPRTLVEIAAAGGPQALAPAWREADFRRLLTMDEIRSDLSATRRAGSPLLRSLLRSVPDPVDASIDIRSRAELLFLRLVEEAGLPAPLVNVAMQVAGKHYVADFFYPGLGLVIEVDDPSHRQQVAIGRDKVRDVEFFIEGLDVMRFETHRLEGEPATCMAQLAAGIERQRRRRSVETSAVPGQARGVRPSW